MGDDGVVRRIDQLGERFRGDSSFEGRVRLHVGETSRDIVVAGGGCRVEEARGSALAEICTDPSTWSEIDGGRLSGIDAFVQGRLVIRGSIEAVLKFEPLFDRPRRGAMRYAVQEVDIGGARISALVAGEANAPPLLLLHGLGATKASWVTLLPVLARRYRIAAIDLPGFGASSKPRGAYDAPWFSRHVFEVMNALGFDHAFVVGNSMGGRIAQEMAMLEPDRVNAIACLCPATAFSERPLLLAARLARAELGVFVSRLPRERIKEALKQMFCDPSRIPDEWFDAAIDDFLTTWKSPRARMAFFASARRIYLDEPSGERGFWARLSNMQPPALYVFGSSDYLISARFGARVQAALPDAKVAVWRDCGHVPQLEFPDRTARTILDFFAATSRAARAHPSRAASL